MLMSTNYRECAKLTNIHEKKKKIDAFMRKGAVFLIFDKKMAEKRREMCYFAV